MDRLPEGWKLGTYLAIIIQLANIGPLLYSCMPKRMKSKRFILTVGYGILLFSFASMIALSFLWHYTWKNHSIALFICTFGTSMCDCMTSLIFWVFASWYPTQYISILSMGESSSGVVASILIWIQQLNSNEPRFSVSSYFFIIALIMPLSMVSLMLLSYLLTNGYFAMENDWISNSIIDNSGTRLDSSSTQNEIDNRTIRANSVPMKENNNNNSQNSQSKQKSKTKNKKSNKLKIAKKARNEKDNDDIVLKSIGVPTRGNNRKGEKTPFLMKDTRLLMYNNFDHGFDNPRSSMTESTFQEDLNTRYANAQKTQGYYFKESNINYTHWLVLLAIISGIQNGCLPSISSYALLSYSNSTYVYATTISTLTNPIAAVISGYFPNTLINKSAVFVSCFALLIGTTYLLFIASLSPNPLGKGAFDIDDSNGWFEFVVVIMYVETCAFISFSKTAMIMLIKKTFVMVCTAYTCFSSRVL